MDTAPTFVPGTFGLLNPGMHRARGLVDDFALLQAILHAERAWIEAQVDTGLVADGRACLESFDAATQALGWAPRPVPQALEDLAAGAESGGNPVIGIVAALRRALEDDEALEAARALHRGLTSQDVLDTALMLLAAGSIEVGLASLAQARARLAEIAEDHAAVLCLARTLTQPAVPMTAGLKIATWVGVLDDAARQLPTDLPLQYGGAGGTRAAGAEFAGEVLDDLLAAWARRLDLRDPIAPWHTRRAPILALASALTGVVTGASRIARDVLEGARSGELSLRRGGGSSAMPQKSNPTLAVLLHRSGIQAPGALSTVASAGAEFVDERPDGAWHAEWLALATLLQLFVTSASQLDDLAAGLQVHPDRMRSHLVAAGQEVVTERLTYALDGRLSRAELTQAAADARAKGTSLRDAVAVALERSKGSSSVDLDALFDPANYLGRSRQLQRRLLEADSPLNEGARQGSAPRH